jgi:predicted peptidase
MAFLFALILPIVHAAAGDPPLPPVTVALSEAHLPTKPGYHVIKAVARLGDKKVPLACGLFLPPAYFKSTERMPIVMTLHTRGNSGADGGGGLVGEGLGLLVATGGPDTRGTGDKPANEMNLPKSAEFIGLVPQCPAGYGWESPQVARILAEFITQIARAGRGDEDRVYLTGFSYGGTSTWEMALQVPGRFAAIVPLDGRATHNPVDDVKKLRDVAIYLGVGGDDADFIPETQRMRDALLADQHASVIFRTVHGGNHWCYGSIYNDPEFWKWLFAQRRHVKLASTRPATQAVK